MPAKTTKIHNVPSLPEAKLQNVSPSVVRLIQAVRVPVLLYHGGHAVGVMQWEVGGPDNAFCDHQIRKATVSWLKRELERIGGPLG